MTNMNTGVEQLPYEERINGAGKQTEVSKKKILWRRWIESKYCHKVRSKGHLKKSLCSRFRPNKSTLLPTD